LGGALSGVPAAPDLSFTAGPGLASALVALLILWVLHRFFFRRLSPRPASLARAGWRDALEGAMLAALLLLATLLPAAAADAFRRPGPGWEPYPPPPPSAPASAHGVAGLFLLQSLSEELAFRGALMGATALLLLFVLTRVLARPRFGEDADAPRLGRRRRLAWLAAGLAVDPLQAGLFAGLHAGNPHASALALVNIGLAGLILGWLYWSQGALWGAWSFHFVWNFSLAALGFPVSGLTPSPPLLHVGVAGARAGLISGGFFGPEGSILATVSLVVILGVLVSRDVSAARKPSGAPEGYPSNP
jgi:membrane protease YdiL (CAAX protease family)